jgi:thiol-disulfide isomerase/thioredoxin
MTGEFRMKMSLQSFRLLSVALAVALISSGVSIPAAFAQEGATQEKESSKDAEEDTEEAEEEKDPFEVPVDCTPEELQEYLTGLKKIRPTSLAMLRDQLLPSVIQTCDLLLEKSPEDEVKLLQEKYSALSALARYAPAKKKELAEFTNKLASDERKEISVIGNSSLLSMRSQDVDSEESALELANDSVALIEKYGLDRQTYGAVSSVARSLGYSDYPEAGARLYESLAPLMAKSEDENMQKRADTMIGAARRLRLMGNTMDVFGKTGAGEEFKWDDYKGKVVLVDFWASWCGPCMAELPNMKRNLEAYGDRGFEIVGINMDSTMKAYEKCLEDKDITWVNIVADGENVGWQAPMATHYGITGIPTAILVNQEGKVVSLSARGAKLDALLADLIGPAEEATEEEAEGSEESDGDK